MTKPKDPEVVEETGAAGRTPEQEAVEDSAETSGEDTEVSEAEAEGADRETDTGASAEPDEAAVPIESPEPERMAESPSEEHEEHEEEPHHRSLAANALIALIGIIAVIVGTLWAAPRVAPHLPAGIAQYLMPGQIETAAEIGTVRQSLADATGRTEALIAAIDERLAATEGGLGDATARLDGLPDLESTTTTASEALRLAEETRGETTGATRRLDAIETEMIGLRESLAAVNATLTGAASGDGTVAPAELAAAVAALNTRFDSLASAVANRADLAALEDRFNDFSGRLDVLEASAANARSAQDQALGEVSTAIREASLRSAVAALVSQVAGGQPYAAPLGEVAALTVSEPPTPLAAEAGTGLATATTLGANFGPLAQAAIAADVQARAGGDTGSQVLGWLRAQVTGRPVTEQAGEGVGAITSRIAARIDEAALEAALTEAESLPDHSKAALGPWLDQLRTRVAAEAALHTWLAELGANG